MSTQSLHRAIQFSNLILKGFYKGFRIRYNLFWCFTWILRYGPKDLTENYLWGLFCPTVYTECTENSLRSTHRLQRAIQTYAESTENNSLSTQWIADLHRVYREQFKSTQSNRDLQRVYTEQFGAYTEQYIPTHSQHRLIQRLHRVYTEFTKSLKRVHTEPFRVYTKSKFLQFCPLKGLDYILPHQCHNMLTLWRPKIHLCRLCVNPYYCAWFCLDTL